jgi:hypothetical protein
MHKPDRWVIIKFETQDETYYKALCGWFGSYLDGAFWRINSGITKIDEEDGYYIIRGYSGSSYKVSKKGYGFSHESLMVWDRIKNDCGTMVSLLDGNHDFKGIKF